MMNKRKIFFSNRIISVETNIALFKFSLKNKNNGVNSKNSIWAKSNVNNINKWGILYV